MNYIIGAQFHLSKTIKARRGLNYLDLADSWDNSDGPIPSKAQCEAGFVAWENRDIQEEKYQGINSNHLLKALALVCADQFGMTPAQLKAAVKAKL